MGSHLKMGNKGDHSIRFHVAPTSLLTLWRLSTEKMGEWKVKMIRDVTPQWLCLLSRMMNSKNLYVNPILLTVFVKIGVS